MNVQQSTDDEYVLICGVPQNAYERVLDAVGDYHIRHTYDHGMLELRRVLYGVSPESYRQLMEALRDHSLRHTYDGWTLEMLAPRKDHEWVAELIGRMLETMAFVLDVPIQSAGSTTLSAAQGERGLQPDKSYYIGKERLVRGSETYRPGEDPPPDLVIEVDVTKTCIPRLPVYAQVGVTEVWRHTPVEMQFYRLGAGGDYQQTDRSDAFPFIAPSDVARFLNQRHDTDENSVVRAFVEWAKEAHGTATAGD